MMTNSKIVETVSKWMIDKWQSLIDEFKFKKIKGLRIAKTSEHVLTVVDECSLAIGRLADIEIIHSPLFPENSIAIRGISVSSSIEEVLALLDTSLIVSVTLLIENTFSVDDVFILEDRLMSMILAHIDSPVDLKHYLTVLMKQKLGYLALNLYVFDQIPSNYSEYRELMGAQYAELARKVNETNMNIGDYLREFYSISCEKDACQLVGLDSSEVVNVREEINSQSKSLQTFQKFENIFTDEGGE